MTCQNSQPATDRPFKTFDEQIGLPFAVKPDRPAWTSDAMVAKGTKSVKRSILTNSLAAFFLVAFGVPQIAAETLSCIEYSELDGIFIQKHLNYT